MMRYEKWPDIEVLPIVGTASIRSYLPKENVYQKELLVGRSEPLSIDGSLWEQIRDPQYRDGYAKATQVDSYFAVCVYALRRVGMISVAAWQGLEKTVSVEHSSTLRQSISQSQRLDVILDGSGYGKRGTVMGQIQTSFELTQEKEYTTEERKTTTTDLRYDPWECDRDVVLWDVAKVVVLYRRLKKSSEPREQLVGLADYYMETYQKTYKYE